VKLGPRSSAPAPWREAARLRGARGGGRGGGGAVSEREQDGVEWRRRRAVEKVRMGAGGGTAQRPAEPRRDRRPAGEEGEAGASML
jgi:hypothetical protein